MAQNRIDPGFKTIVQIAVVVRDIERAAAHWAALLGVPAPKISTTRPGHEVDSLYYSRPTDARAKLCFFNTGTCILELIEPLEQGSDWYDQLAKHGPSVHHIAFKVQDLPTALAHCATLGLHPTHQGDYDRRDGSYTYLNSRNPLGVVIELLHSRFHAQGSTPA